MGLTLVSEDLLFDGIFSLGLMVSFYYVLTGLACPIVYRRQILSSPRELLWLGVAPTAGALVLAWAFVRSSVDLADPSVSPSGDVWFGVGPPLVIGIGALVLGAGLMWLQSRAEPAFFRGSEGNV